MLLLLLLNSIFSAQPELGSTVDQVIVACTSVNAATINNIVPCTLVLRNAVLFIRYSLCPS